MELLTPLREHKSSFPKRPVILRPGSIGPKDLVFDVAWDLRA